MRTGYGDDTSEDDGVSGTLVAAAAAAVAATSIEAVSGARSFFPVAVSLHYYDDGSGSGDDDGKSDGDDGSGGGGGDGRTTTTGHTHRGRAIGRCGGAR